MARRTRCLNRFRSREFRTMGVHQFMLTLVPKSYYECQRSVAPAKLSPEEIERGGHPENGWWASNQPSAQMLGRLRALLPKDESWGETEEFTTSAPWSSDLRIWKENNIIFAIDFRFSPITDSRCLLDCFVEIARESRCLLLESETGSMFEPENSSVSEHLNSSRAMRFTRDPEGAIVESAKDNRP